MDSAVKASLLVLLLSCVSAQNWAPECAFVDSFCDPDKTEKDEFPLIVNTGTADTATDAAEECYDACFADTATCKAFTVVKTGRRPPRCYLLKEACKDNIVDDCIAMGNCVSGPNDCTLPPVTCPVVPTLNEGFVRWQCLDINYEPINPYVEEPPAKTICFQTCPSWKSADDTSARLKSVCEGAGTWSEVQNYDEAEMAYPLYPESMASYPTPDTSDEGVALTCGCLDLELKWPYEDVNGDVGNGDWYDPNTEDAAEFICDNPVEIGADGEYKIVTDNTCVLYCDDHYVATAKCLNGAWSGNPEWGFWCYEEPSL